MAIASAFKNSAENMFDNSGNSAATTSKTIMRIFRLCDRLPRKEEKEGKNRMNDSDL